jgi:type II secretory pathway pseudopilin PulG
MNGRVGLSGNCGVTYLAALMIVVVMGILLGKAGQTWTAAMQREREEELLFRGLQIQRALQKWHQPRSGEHVATKLTNLNDLLKDPRTPQTVHHLRRLYRDPVSKKDWLLIMDPTKGIVGVKPDSDAAPLKQNGFSGELNTLAGKQKYRDWEFRYRPTTPTISTKNTTTTTTTTPVRTTVR